MKKQPTKLPDKPSALIRLALRDLEKCERSKLYKINMAEWHQPNGECAVCLAGSVMAQSLNVPRQCDNPWYLFDTDTETKLGALNDFRCGMLHYPLANLGLPTGSLPQYCDIADYHFQPQEFKRDMLKLASLLAKEGL